MLIIARCILAILFCLCLTVFLRGVKRTFGRDAWIITTLVIASQFHLMYYSSRFLPNTFAVALGMTACTLSVADPFLLVLLSVGVYILAFRRLSIVLLTVASSIFRFEIVLLVVFSLMRYGRSPVELKWLLQSVLCTSPVSIGNQSSWGSNMIQHSPYDRL